MDTEEQGYAIARELGHEIEYRGPQFDRGGFIGHVFLDTVTGTSIMCNDVQSCKQTISDSRKAFNTQTTTIPKVNWNMWSTDLPYYDGLLKNPAHYRKAKGVTGAIEYFTADQYMDEAAKFQNVTRQREYEMLDHDLVARYARKMETGDRFPIPVLDYAKQDQEGRHRAAAAARLGETRIPVLVVRKVEEIQPSILNPWPTPPHYTLRKQQPTKSYAWQPLKPLDPPVPFDWGDTHIHKSITPEIKARLDRLAARLPLNMRPKIKRIMIQPKLMWGEGGPGVDGRWIGAEGILQLSPHFSNSTFYHEIAHALGMDNEAEAEAFNDSFPSVYEPKTNPGLKDLTPEFKGEVKARLAAKHERIERSGKAVWIDGDPEPTPELAGEAAAMEIDTMPNAVEQLKIEWISDRHVKVSPAVNRDHTIHEVYWVKPDMSFLSPLKQEEKIRFENGAREWLRRFRNLVTKQMWPDTTNLRLVEHKHIKDSDTYDYSLHQGSDIIGEVTTKKQGNTLVVIELQLHEKGVMNRAFLEQLQSLLFDEVRKLGLHDLSIVHRERNRDLYEAAGFIRTGTTFTKGGLQPEVLSRYPLGDVPKYTEKETGVPESPMPVPKGSEIHLTVYPRILSMEEFRKEWEPQGWKLIFIGPTATWRQEWGPWEAIRDLVQNALDEIESYQWGRDSEGLWIADQGKGVAVADFLLGPPKLKPDYARGRFGEGMKIASLALLREGYPIHVDTVGKELYMIFIEQEAGGVKVQSLAALWRPDGTREGTRFHIIGYTGPAYEDRFAVNLPKSAIVVEAPAFITGPKKRFNQIIEYPFGTNRIYARDIYMRDIKSPFSYNLWGFEMSPDRFGPKTENDVWVDIGRTWCYATDLRLIQIFLQMVADPPLLEGMDESHAIIMDRWDMGSVPGGNMYGTQIFENGEIWRAAWNSVFGEGVVIRTDSGLDGVVKHLGYKSQSVFWAVREVLSNVVKTDRILLRESQERLREVQVIPDDQLTPRQRVHLYLARQIVNVISSSVEGVHAGIIPPASDRVRTAGMYGRTTAEIFIAVEQLQTGQKTVDTTIHELAHHTSGAEDLQDAHSQAMTRIAGQVVSATSNGRLDEIIRTEDFSWY